MAAIFRRVRKVLVRIFRRDRKRTFSINESSKIKRRSGFEDYPENCSEWRYNPQIDFDLGSSEESVESENFEETENFCRQNLTFECRHMHRDEDEVNSNEQISIIDIQRRSDILEVLTTQEILPFDDDILNLPTAVSPPLPQPSQSRNTTGNNNGFIWVQNYLPIFPESLKLTACFCDYLNYRCQSGDILSNLLHRKVFYDKEESSNNSSSEFSNANTPTVQQQEFRVSDLIRVNFEGLFYSFCLGKIAFVDEVDHCTECHTCYEYQSKQCGKCGSSWAQFCPKCNNTSRTMCEICGLDVSSWDSWTHSIEDCSVHSISQLDIQETDDTESQLTEFSTTVDVSDFENGIFSSTATTENWKNSNIQGYPL